MKIPTNNDMYIKKIYICGFVYHRLKLVHCMSNCCLKRGLPFVVRHSFVFSFQHVCIIFMSSLRISHKLVGELMKFSLSLYFLLE